MDKELFQVLEAAAALDAGIVPPDMVRSDPNVLKNMPLEEQRASKRKFRKIKRKIAKATFSDKKKANLVSCHQISMYLLEKASLANQDLP